MGTFMPVRYDQDTRAKAIRPVREHAGDYPSEYAAITTVARAAGDDSGDAAQVDTAGRRG